jgi:hypothetical protein
VIAVGAQALTFTTKKEGHRSGTATVADPAATTRDHNMSETRSAADHPWRSIHVMINPLNGRAYVAVHVRGHRGITTEWRHDVTSIPVPIIPLDDDPSVGDVLQASAIVLQELVKRAAAR